MFQQINEGIVIKVKVIPKASRSEIAGWENEELKIRLAAVPDKGQANAELIRFLAEWLGIGKCKKAAIMTHGIGQYTTDGNKRGGKPERIFSENTDEDTWHDCN